MKSSSPSLECLRRGLSALFLAFLVVGISFPSMVEGQDPLKPSKRDKCPVCGMFVAKYPDWTAVMLFRDKPPVFFDGAKDLFKYYSNPKQYDQSRKISEVTGIRVMDYYSLSHVEGREAFYVVGSDVYGPMGRELIPFGKRSDAEEFLRDHKGTRILRFNEVTQALLKELDS